MLTSVVAQTHALGGTIAAGQGIPWEPRLAPTQIRLVEFLQLLRQYPLGISFNRASAVLSACDKVEEEGRTSERFLAERLPLLKQYLDLLLRRTGSCPAPTHGSIAA
jgi:hypothetical protein